MNTPIAEDFAYIAQKLKQIEQDKLKEVLEAPLLDVQPLTDTTYDAYGYPNGTYPHPVTGGWGQDYDPA